MTPTYGNTLMGLAASAPSGPHNSYKIAYYAPQPRAVIEVVTSTTPTGSSSYGETGRVKLTTLTKEFFMPGFLERDEGEREPPYEQYPWDGVSGVRPYRGFAATTTVGVYLKVRSRDLSPEAMLNLPVLRWGEPYTSMDVDEVVHFATGEPIAQRQPRQRRPDPARHAQGRTRPRRAARHSRSTS